MNFEVNKQNFELKFGFGVFFLLARNWRLDSFQKVLNKIVKEFSKLSGDKQGKEAVDIAFETLRILSEVIEACIVNKKENGVKIGDLEEGDICDAIFKNPEVMGTIFQQLIDSMPKAQTPVPGEKK